MVAFVVLDGFPSWTRNLIGRALGKMALNFPQTNLHSRTRLAALKHSGDPEIDMLLADVARQLKRDGYRVGGVVRSNRRQPGDHRCDMVLEELTTGKTISIFQQLGTGSKGCRLDTAALEHVVGLVDGSLDRGLDILIVNKFGKREADGRGFSATIAQAVSTMVPVLITLNQDYAAPWRHFCGGEGETITADRASVSQWLAECLPSAHVS